MKKFDVIFLTVLVFVTLYFIFYFVLSSMEIIYNPTLQLTISGIAALVLGFVLFRALNKK